MALRRPAAPLLALSCRSCPATFTLDHAPDREAFDTVAKAKGWEWYPRKGHHRERWAWTCPACTPVPAKHLGIGYSTALFKPLK